MKIQKRVIEGIIPYVIVVDDGVSTYVHKKDNGKDALFRTQNAAEKRAMWISSQHPRWKLVIKQCNGVAF
jgi:trehalose utilization protein